MTYSESLALLKKYGLKSDTKSIKERILANRKWNGYYLDADLSILFHRAEMGERAEEIIVDKRNELSKMYSIVCETEPQKAIAKTVDNVLDEIITALRGEGQGK